MDTMIKDLDIDLELAEQTSSDYIFGAFLPLEEINPSGDWTEYLVAKEYQNMNGVEPYACVSYTILNAVEMLIKKKYGEERNYSDRFLAVISGTGKGGNAPKTVCNALKHNGTTKESLYPFNVKTFEEYYGEVPQEIIDLAKEFNKEWIFKYERVSTSQIDQALKCSPLLISVPAWFERQGKYFRPKNMRDNHATTLIAKDKVFDSYVPTIKKLDNIEPMVAYRFYVEKKVEKVKEGDTIKESYTLDFRRLLQIIRALFSPQTV